MTELDLEALKALLPDLLAAAEREAKLRAALTTVRYEMAALVQFPDRPNFHAACANPADADCLMRAYEAVSQALAEGK